MNIAGVYLADPSEVAAAVARQLRKGTVWNARDDYHRVDGLDRAIAESGAWKPHFAASVGALLEDPDPAVRTGAIRVLPSVAAEIGADRLMDLLETKPELFVDVDPVGYRLFEPLDGHLLDAIGNVADRDDARASKLLREGLKRGRHCVQRGLARVDPDHAVTHAADLGREFLGAVLKGLPSAPYRERFVRALAPWPDPQQILDHVLWGVLEITDIEKDRLRRIIAGEKVDDRSQVLWGSGNRRFLVPVGAVVQPGELPLTSMYGDVAYLDEATVQPFELTREAADAWLDQRAGGHLELLVEALARAISRPKS